MPYGKNFNRLRFIMNQIQNAIVTNANTIPAENVQVQLLGIEPVPLEQAASPSPPLPFPLRFPILLKSTHGDGTTINPQATVHFGLFKLETSRWVGLYQTLPQCIGVWIEGYAPFLIRETRTSLGGAQGFPQQTFLVEISSRRHSARRYLFRMAVVRRGAGGPTFEIEPELSSLAGAVELRREFDGLFRKWNLEWNGQEIINAHDAKGIKEMLEGFHARLLELIARMPNWTQSPDDKLSLALVELQRFVREIAFTEAFSQVRTDTWQRGRQIFSQISKSVDTLIDQQ